jgi:uncharacterized protein (DUF302 family)
LWAILNILDMLIIPFLHLHATRRKIGEAFVIQSEDKIGVFLPCNIIIEEHKNGTIEVSAVDPIASMGAVQNEALGSIATEVQSKLKSIIENL